MLSLILKLCLCCYDVNLDNNEICSLLCSQEDLSYLAITIINVDDIVLVPNPSYPIFRDSPLLDGTRIGFAIDNSQIIEQIKKSKSNIDYNMFIPIQLAAIQSISGDQHCQAYQQHRDTFQQCAKNRLEN